MRNLDLKQRAKSVVGGLCPDLLRIFPDAYGAALAAIGGLAFSLRSRDPCFAAHKIYAQMLCN